MSQALFWYQQIVQLADSGSPDYKTAKDKAKAVRDKIDARGDTQSSRRRYITRKMSEAMGAEFDKARDDLRKRALEFDLKAVRAEIERMHKGTRDKTPERERIDAELVRLGRIEKVFGTVPSRAGGLPENKIVWNRYDRVANPDLIVQGADQKGVQLYDEVAEQKKTIPWREIAPTIRLSFLEALRNGNSAEETALLGYYARLLGRRKSRPLLRVRRNDRQRHRNETPNQRTQKRGLGSSERRQPNSRLRQRSPRAQRAPVSTGINRRTKPQRIEPISKPKGPEGPGLNGVSR